MHRFVFHKNKFDSVSLNKWWKNVQVYDRDAREAYRSICEMECMAAVSMPVILSLWHSRQYFHVLLAVAAAAATTTTTTLCMDYGSWIGLLKPIWLSFSIERMQKMRMIEKLLKVETKTNKVLLHLSTAIICVSTIHKIWEIRIFTCTTWTVCAQCALRSMRLNVVVFFSLLNSEEENVEKQIYGKKIDSKLSCCFVFECRILELWFFFFRLLLSSQTRRIIRKELALCSQCPRLWPLHHLNVDNQMYSECLNFFQSMTVKKIRLRMYGNPNNEFRNVHLCSKTNKSACFRESMCFDAMVSPRSRDPLNIEHQHSHVNMHTEK